MDTFIREQVWLEAFTAVTTKSNCNTIETATAWANQCLEKFDEKFPKHKRKYDEQNKG